MQTSTEPIMVVWTLLPCVVVTLIIMVQILHTRKERAKRVSRESLPLPPGPKGHPILGNLLYVIGPLRHNPHRGLASLAETYGPIMSFRLGLTRSLVVVSSAAMAHEILVKNDAALAARLVPDNVCALSYSSTSMVFLPSSNQLWKQLRVTIGSRFSSSRGLDMTRVILEHHARQLTVHLRACSGKPVSIREAVSGTVLNVISNVLFSKDVVDLCDPRAQWFRGLIAPVLEEWSKPSVSDAFPFLAPLDHLLGSRSRISTHLAKLFKFFKEEIIERRLASNEKHDDLLDVLLARHASSKITLQQISTFLTDMFIAASETSTSTVQWAMAQLLHHPEKMEKVSAELALRLGSKDYVEESDLDKLPYLQAVVKETLRLHPALPLIPREVVAHDGVSLSGLYHLPVETGVVINLWAIGRDPMVWPQQPEKFMPERFLGDNAMHFQSKDFAFRPFGAGRRVCPGMDYTVRSVPLLLALILHKTEWRLPDGIATGGVDLNDRYGTVLNLATPLRAVPLVSTTV
ncbi:hypothetical protein PR202_gb28344 [Eleusine coracana subsp. coracana]|uniref:Uncharacterized protein n=1 Tax=Eleusine coracana subsp. coracana TaxID=191504 RepID=A0AAV5FU71_ELECO|nr:hypothetical protein QOZ80_6AG0549570 [Eleusine coracana subsp. coracana]GJN39239.1 hypothetical protein PR202_gb28344 [Eleusine coracana subsp. coracana]